MNDEIKKENQEKGKELSFEKLLEHLEVVVKQLESGELTLENSLKAYEHGVGLVRQSQERLQKMEGKIEQLMANGKKQPLNEDAPF